MPSGSPRAIPKGQPLATSKPSSVQKRRAQQIVGLLSDLYPEPECALIHEGPWQLLCATILSAQCTDVRVNTVTPALFARYPTPHAMANAEPGEVELLIKSTGFFRQKALSLISMSQDVVQKFGGTVPANLEHLVTLRGVGRKTANVVIGVAYGGAGMVVDTHVRRLSRRLGWTVNDDPVKIERDLMALHPETIWTALGHRLILHGRSVCVARTPKCNLCTISQLCPYALAKAKRPVTVSKPAKLTKKRADNR